MRDVAPRRAVLNILSAAIPFPTLSPSRVKYSCIFRGRRDAHARYPRFYLRYRDSKSFPLSFSFSLLITGKRILRKSESFSKIYIEIVYICVFYASRIQILIRLYCYGLIVINWPLLLNYRQR